LHTMLTTSPQGLCRHANMTEHIFNRSSITKVEAHRVVSSLLSYPLTLSLAINTLFTYHKPSLHIIILGARSEASLPASWWKELLYTQNNAKDVKITMVGPGQQLFTKVTHQRTWEEKSIEITTGSHLGLFHDLPNVHDLLRSADLFVCFHPGFGNSFMRPMWTPTLDLLFQTRKPIFCTAYSPTDIAADLTQLGAIADELDEQDLGEALEFILNADVNPFASMQAAISEQGEVTVTNHFAYCFQAK
jgi:splicing suppressor protein 51